MNSGLSSHISAHTRSIPMLEQSPRRARQLDSRLWALLTQPQPLTAAEQAYIDEQERLGAASELDA